MLLHWLSGAAQCGDTAAIQEWFSTGTRDPDEKDENGWTLLRSATCKGQIETMRVILAHGASAGVIDDDGFGMTVLHHAALHGQCAAAVLLLDYGAQVDAHLIQGTSPLFAAALNGECEMIRLLLHRGADLDARDENGDLAESLAWQFSRPEATALLADVRRAGGWRPYVGYPRLRLLMLRIVAEQGRAETQDALLRRVFPAGPPALEGTKRPREAYRAQKGGRLPRGIFMHILGYWRSNRDYSGPDGA